MELGGGSSNYQGKASEGNVLCYCGLPAWISQSPRIFKASNKAHEMEQFLVTALPEDIQARVAECVAANSVADLYRLRATCKSMKELTDRAGVYAALDVFTFPSYLHVSNLVM